MSPSQLVREKLIELLADPQTGLNPVFVQACQSRQIEIPIAGDGGNSAAPFTFGANSSTVLLMRADIDAISKESNQQYPCILLFTRSAKQSRGERPYGAVFAGDVVTEMSIYVAWLNTDTPPDSNFEVLLDALEDSVLTVLNRDCTVWIPVLYRNQCDIVERSPLISAGELLRRGIRFEITARVAV